VGRGRDKDKSCRDGTTTLWIIWRGNHGLHGGIGDKLFSKFQSVVGTAASSDYVNWFGDTLYVIKSEFTCRDQLLKICREDVVGFWSRWAYADARTFQTQRCGKVFCHIVLREHRISFRKIAVAYFHSYFCFLMKQENESNLRQLFANAVHEICQIQCCRQLGMCTAALVRWKVWKPVCEATVKFWISEIISGIVVWIVEVIINYIGGLKWQIII